MLAIIYIYTEYLPLGLPINYHCADTYILKVGLQTRNLVGSTKKNPLNCFRAISHITAGPKNQRFRDLLCFYHQCQGRKQSLTRLVVQGKFSGYIQIGSLKFDTNVAFFFCCGVLS